MASLEQKKLLQFLRSSSVYDTKELAKAALYAVDFDIECDGTPVAARYKKEEKVGTTTTETIKTMLGLVYKKGTDRTVTILEEISEDALVKYVGVGAIAIDDEADEYNEKKVQLVIPTDEKVLSQDESGLTTTLKLEYVTVNPGDPTEYKAIQLLGIGDELIDEIDATDFVKDGFLSSATYDESAHTLTLVWNIDAMSGDTPLSAQTTVIPLSGLVDLYDVSGVTGEIAVSATTDIDTKTGLEKTVYIVGFDDEMKYLSGVSVNNVSGEVIDKHAYVTIDSSDIKVADDFVAVDGYNTAFTVSGIAVALEAIASGETETVAYQKLEKATVATVDKAVENEKAILDLANAAGTISGGTTIFAIKYVPYSGSVISAATTLSEADAMLNDAIEALEKVVVSASGATCIEVTSDIIETAEGKKTLYNVELNHTLAVDAETDPAGFVHTEVDGKTILGISFDFGVWSE